MKKFEEAIDEFEKVWKAKYPEGFLAHYIEAVRFYDGCRRYTCRIHVYTGDEETDEDIRNVLILEANSETYDEAETKIIEQINKKKEELNDKSES